MKPHRAEAIAKAFQQVALTDGAEAAKELVDVWIETWQREEPDLYLEDVKEASYNLIDECVKKPQPSHD